MLYLSCNHIPTGEMVEGKPWLFSPDHELPDHIRDDKKARQDWIQSPHTRWNYWTFHVGKNKAQRVSQQNPPMQIGGFAVDLDHSQAFKRAADFAKGLPFKPIWIEQSLSRKGCRLVFEFESPVNVGNFELGLMMNKLFAEKLGVTTLPGYDEKSTDPCMVWSNGAVWQKVEGGAPVPSHVVFSWQKEALADWNTSDKMGIEVPLDVAYKLCKEKFGDKFRWPTDSFSLEQHGPTWYVEGSESEASAVIKRHGIYSFFSHASDRPFRSWDDPILLGKLVDEYRQVNIADAVKGVHYDGKVYWHQNKVSRSWVADPKEVFARKLKVENQLSAQPGKGRRFSELEEALNYVETNQRVEYATALLCVRPGVVERDGKPVFNYAQPVLIQPHEQAVPQWGHGFPFIARFLDTVWDDPAGQEGVQRSRFLMSAKRLYYSFSEFQSCRHAAMFLVGPKNIGKTFLSTGLLGTMLGGSNDPTSTLIDGNRFNADMLGTPVWSLDDPQGTNVPADKFADMLKRFVANPEIRSEQKFVQGGMGSFNGIICVTMNDDAASLVLLPEVSRSNRDKWQFFKLRQSEVVFGKSEPENKATLYRELPYFVRWLQDWQVPAELEERFKPVARWGHETYLHPALLEASNHGSMKEFYRHSLIAAIRSHSSDLSAVKQVTMSTPHLLRCMRQAMHGVDIRYSPKSTDRYMAEFAEEGWPVQRVQAQLGLTEWVIQTDFFKGDSNATN